MSYEISVPNNGRYVLIRVTEDITSEIASQVAREASEFGAARKLDKYLFDVRAAANIATLPSHYELAAEELPALGFPAQACFAVLVKAGDISHDVVVTLVKQIGFNTHLFSDEEEALNWLEVC